MITVTCLSRLIGCPSQRGGTAQLTTRVDISYHSMDVYCSHHVVYKFYSTLCFGTISSNVCGLQGILCRARVLKIWCVYTILFLVCQGVSTLTYFFRGHVLPATQLDALTTVYIATNGVV